MAALLYHPGTGTIIDATDDVFLIITDDEDQYEEVEQTLLDVPWSEWDRRSYSLPYSVYDLYANIDVSVRKHIK